MESLNKFRTILQNGVNDEDAEGRGDSTLASELRRKLVKIAADPNLIPGVFFVTADYMNYSEY